MTEKDKRKEELRARIEDLRRNNEAEDAADLQETLVDLCEREYEKEPVWENARVLIEEYIRQGIFSDEINCRNAMRKVFSKAERLCSRFPEAGCGIYEKPADTYFSMKIYEKAAELYIKAAELSGDYEQRARFYLKAAGSYTEDFRPEEAELYINKAAEGESSPGIHRLICRKRGSRLHSLKKYKEAYKYLTEAPEDVPACLMIADSIKKAPLPEADFSFYTARAAELAEKSEDVRLKMISEGFMFFMCLNDGNCDNAGKYLEAALAAAENAGPLSPEEQELTAFLYEKAEDFYIKTKDNGKLKEIREKQKTLSFPRIDIKENEDFLLHPDIIINYPDALYGTGNLYYEHESVFYNDDRALRLISLAAQKGSTDAEKLLLIIYANRREFAAANRLCAVFTEKYRKDTSPEGRKLLADGYEIWGSILLAENSCMRSLVCYLTAVEIRRQNLMQDMSIENKRLLSESCCKLGCYYMHWEDKDEAEEWFREDLKYFEDVCDADPTFDNLFSLQRKYLNLGHTICSANLKESALPFYIKAINLKDRIFSFPETPDYVMFHLAYAYNMAGEIYKRLYKDKEKAVFYYMEYYKTTMARDSGREKAICCRETAECFMYFKDWDKAEKYMLQSIEITETDEETSDFDIVTRFGEMADIYRAKGDSGKAAYYHNKYIEGNR